MDEGRRERGGTTESGILMGKKREIREKRGSGAVVRETRDEERE